uniref:Nuclear pore complex interacting protein N-terminal domain-containing protein n=3 Tax=Pan troglodytes TaxID=9598 RepID=H2QE93_PANTR
MVKLSIVLTPQFLSHDQGQLTKELQQHVKSVTCPCEYLRKVINTLADHHHRGTDFGGSPWLGIIIEFLRSYKVVITLWTVYLWLSFLKTIFQSENGHDGSTDVQQRARRSNRRRQEGLRSICMHTKKRVSSFPGNKIGRKDVITLRRHVKRKVRDKIHKMKVTPKINHHDKINGKRKTAKKQKTYQPAQELRRRAEDYHKCKIPPSARKPLCNWVRMAAAEHRHSSGLPHWPYLTAETLKNRMGHQPPPPTQQRSITENSLSLKTPPECPLHPLPPSADDNLKTPPECLITLLPPSAPPSCLLYPPPPSADDNLKTPPEPAECLLYPPPPSADDNLKTPPECLITPLPPSPPPSAPPSLTLALNSRAQVILPPQPPKYATTGTQTPFKCWDYRWELLYTWPYLSCFPENPRLG